MPRTYAVNTSRGILKADTHTGADAWLTTSGPANTQTITSLAIGRGLIDTYRQASAPIVMAQANA